MKEYLLELVRSSSTDLLTLDNLMQVLDEEGIGGSLLGLDRT